MAHPARKNKDEDPTHRSFVLPGTKHSPRDFPLTGQGRYVFPSPRTDQRPMSNNAERNCVRAAYNYAEFLPKRREMMQALADYLDHLRTSGTCQIVTIRAVS